LIVVWCKDCRSYTFCFKFSDQNFEEKYEILIQSSMKFIDECFAVVSKKAKASLPLEIEGWKV